MQHIELSELERHIKQTLTELSSGDEPLAVELDGREVAVILPASLYRKLEILEDYLDRLEIDESRQEAGEDLTLEDVKARLRV